MYRARNHLGLIRVHTVNMYRPHTSFRDRAGTIVLVVLIHAALLYAFLNLSGRMPELVKQANLQLIDILNPPPPPPPPVVEQAKAKPKKAEGAAAPKNIESKATPVVRPIPKVVIPVPAKIVTAPTPGTGAQATQGASTPGPGTGAGGAGSGTGGGGAGTGSGGGGGIAVRPALLRGITNRDYPEAIQRNWPRGGQVFVRVRVETNGRPSKCDVMRSFGDPGIDQWTCSLVMSRASFRPATDASGRPVSAWFGYVQSDQGRFER